MIHTTLATLAAAALAVSALGSAAPSTAAPPNAVSAQATIDRLELEGYKVILNKVGSAPLQQCTVTAVRPGTDITHRVSDPGGGGGGTTIEVLYTTVYVDAKC